MAFPSNAVPSMVLIGEKTTVVQGTPYVISSLTPYWQSGRRRITQFQVLITLTDAAANAAPWTVTMSMVPATNGGYPIVQTFNMPVTNRVTSRFAIDDLPPLASITFTLQTVDAAKNVDIALIGILA